jgi:hypothetical protein
LVVAPVGTVYQVPGTWHSSEWLTAGRLLARQLSSHPNLSRLLKWAVKNSFPSRLSHIWLDWSLFKLAAGWLSGGIIVPALALDGADLGLREDLANFWQNGFLMTIPL